MTTGEDFVGLPGVYILKLIKLFSFPSPESGIFKWRKEKLLPLTRIMVSMPTKSSHLSFFILTEILMQTV